MAGFVADQVPMAGQTSRWQVSFGKWCMDMNKQNAFASPGSRNLQHSAFKRHQTNFDHILTAESWHRRMQGFTIQKQREQATEADRNANDPGKTALLRTILCVAKKAFSLNQENNLMKLLL